MEQEYVQMTITEFLATEHQEELLKPKAERDEKLVRSTAFALMGWFRAEMPLSWDRSKR